MHKNKVLCKQEVAHRRRPRSNNVNVHLVPSIPEARVVNFRPKRVRAEPDLGIS